MKLYHWSTNVVTEPRIKGNCGYGFYMAKNRKYSRLFGDVLHKVTVMPKNTFVLNDKEVRKYPFFNIDKEHYEDYIKKGYDSLAWYRNGELCEFIALKPEIIKDIEVIGTAMREQKLNLNDIKTIVAEVVNRVYNSVNEIDNPMMQNVNDDAGKSYEAIGFANKFYTLWSVYETKYKKIYTYIKNISFSKERAHQLYPNAEFVDELRGKTHSFIVSVGDSLGSEFERFANPTQVAVAGGPTGEIRMIVIGISNGKTKYGNMYKRIVGDDLEGTERFVINVFEKRDDMPKVGDIIKVNGEVGFYHENEDLIFLNNATWTFESRHQDDENQESIEDGAKLKNEKMVVLQHTRGEHYIDGAFKKPGFIILANENGTEFYVDSYVRDFRGLGGVQKFKDILDDIVPGKMFLVSGTVQIKDGYNRIIRAKLELCNNQTEDEEEVKTGGIFDNGVEYRNYIKVVEHSFIGETTRERNKTMKDNIYKMPIDKYNDFVDFISKTIREHNADISISNWSNWTSNGMNYDIDSETLKNVAKEKLSNCDSYDYVCFSLKIPETKEHISYALYFYREN